MKNKDCLNYHSIKFLSNIIKENLLRSKINFKFPLHDNQKPMILMMCFLGNWETGKTNQRNKIRIPIILEILLQNQHRRRNQCRNRHLGTIIHLNHNNREIIIIIKEIIKNHGLRMLRVRKRKVTLIRGKHFMIMYILMEEVLIVIWFRCWRGKFWI